MNLLSSVGQQETTDLSRKNFQIAPDNLQEVDIPDYEASQNETPAKIRKTRKKSTKSASRLRKSRYAMFAGYLTECFEKLPNTVARSLEIEFLSRVHSVIDLYESSSVKETDN